MRAVERATRATSAALPKPFEGEPAGVKRKKKKQAKRGGRQAGMKGSGRAAAAKQVQRPERAAGATVLVSEFLMASRRTG